MKLRFSLLLFAIINSVSGQSSVYHPFPDSNAVWNIHTRSVNGTMCSITEHYFFEHYFSYFIHGDTVINNLTYHKLYSSGYYFEHCQFGNTYWNWFAHDSVYRFALREDLNLKKVYIYEFGEYLLYDFNVNIGDTMHDWENCIVVSSIDSVLIGNNYRKRFNTSIGQYSIIEGIGSTSGLFVTLCPFEFWGDLTCFSQNGQTLYPDTSFSCELINDVKIISNDENQVTISPNPFHLTTTLELQNEFKGAELIIYNTLGKKVMHQKIVSKQTVINRDGLPNGIYFYQIAGNENKYISGKLIID